MVLLGIRANAVSVGNIVLVEIVSNEYCDVCSRRVDLWDRYRKSLAILLSPIIMQVLKKF